MCANKTDNDVLIEQGKQLDSLISTAAEESPTVSVVSQEDVPSSHTKHVGAGGSWIHINNPQENIADFYNRLPPSVRKILTVKPYQEGLCFVSYYQPQVQDPVTFNTRLSEPTSQKLLDQCIEHINYLYTDSTLTHHIEGTASPVVEATQPSTIYVMADTLENLSIDIEQSHSILHLLSLYHLMPTEVHPAPPAHTYDYQIELGWQFGVKQNPKDVIEEFIEKVLEIYSFPCRNCGEQAVLQTEGTRAFFCTNCYTQYHASGIDYVDEFFRHTPQQFIRVLGNTLTEQQSHSQADIHCMLQENAQQFPTTESDIITVKDPPNRMVKYEFREDSVMQHIFYKHLYVKIPLGESYTRKHAESETTSTDAFKTASCRLCATHIDYMDIRLMGSTQIILNPPTERTSVADYTKICPSCLTNALGDTEELLHETVSDEVILSRTI